MPYKNIAKKRVNIFIWIWSYACTAALIQITQPVSEQARNCLYYLNESVLIHYSLTIIAFVCNIIFATKAGERKKSKKMTKSGNSILTKLEKTV